MAHLRGIPTHLRERYDVPVVFYDGDVPMSLPEFGGMDTGFNYYHGADPSEYDLVISNSEGGLERLRELGARRAESVFWAAGPELFQPAPVEKEYDVFFYGYGDKFRREWMRALIGEPSREPDAIDFALGGDDFRGDVGNARLIGDVPFNVFSQAISRARINLNITRRSHATVYASSTCRPFELAACGGAIVSNPVEGLERWFEPGSEVRVVSNAEEALATYRELLDDPGAAGERGAYVIRLPFNLGIGGAVQTGYRFAFERGYDIAVQVDGDGQHDPAQLPLILGPVLGDDADLVVGSRFAGEGAYRSTVARRAGIRIFAAVVSAVVRQRLTDTTPGRPAVDR